MKQGIELIVAERLESPADRFEELIQRLIVEQIEVDQPLQILIRCSPDRSCPLERCAEMRFIEGDGVS